MGTGGRKGLGSLPVYVTKFSLEWSVQEAFSTVVTTVNSCLKTPAARITADQRMYPLVESTTLFVESAPNIAFKKKKKRTSVAHGAVPWEAEKGPENKTAEISRV